MAKPWDEESLRQLLGGVGSNGIRWFQKRTNAPGDYAGAERSRDAVYAAARRLCGPGGLTRGAFTLRRLILETGFERSQLLRARDALKQKWKRLGPRGAHLITDEQADEVLEWLKHDYWSKKLRLYCCLGCQTDSRLHFRLGLCRPCYFGYRRRCESLDLPTRQNILLKRVQSLDKTEDHGKVLEITARLEKGHALSTGHLELIHMLLPKVS